MSIITNIEEINFYHNGIEYEGVVISLSDERSVKVGIESGQSCCEQYGYITSHDNYSDFIGSDFLDSYLTTRDLCTIEDLDNYEGNMMFFTIKTSAGDLQFVAYNDHNGYYGHDVVLVENSSCVEQGCL